MPKPNCEVPSPTRDLTAKRSILESDTNTARDNMVASSLKEAMVAGTPEPRLKEPATAAPVAEQPASVLHQNNPEESHGLTVSISDQLKPGKLFAWFELQREIDIVSTGVVWLAQDYGGRRQVEQVALKFLPDFIVSDKATVEEVKNEIRRRIPLKHPNILRAYDVVESK